MFDNRQYSTDCAIAQGVPMKNFRLANYALMLSRAWTAADDNPPPVAPLVRVVRTPRGEDEPSWN